MRNGSGHYGSAPILWLADPSLQVALLDLTPATLATDDDLCDSLFTAQVIHDLSVMGDVGDCIPYYLINPRASSTKLVLSVPGRVFELIAINSTAADLDHQADQLLKSTAQLDGKPEFLLIITATGPATTLEK